MTDVGRTPEEPATLSRRPGRGTRLPLLLPPERVSGRSVLAWRGRRLALPRSFDPSHVTRAGVIGPLGYTPPRVVSLGWDGAATRLWKGEVDGLVEQVVAGDGGRLWWGVDSFEGDDQVVSWDPDLGPEAHTIDLGERPRPSAELAQEVVGVIAADDVVLRGWWWARDSSRTPIQFRRTSGRPAEWELDGTTTMSARADRVVGLSSAYGAATCLAAYALDASAPAWVRCLERDGRPAQVVSSELTPDGERLVVLVRGGRWVGPGAFFHVGRDTLLVLDPADGRILERVDHNFDQVVLEGDRHVVFVRQDRPRAGGTDEGPYVAQLVRCAFTGACETVGRPRPADTTTGAVRPLG